MSRIETGTANPSLEAAKVLADGLGMTLSELLEGLQRCFCSKFDQITIQYQWTFLAPT